MDKCSGCCNLLVLWFTEARCEECNKHMIHDFFYNVSHNNLLCRGMDGVLLKVWTWSYTINPIVQIEGQSLQHMLGKAVMMLKVDFIMDIHSHRVLQKQRVKYIRRNCQGLGSGGLPGALCRVHLALTWLEWPTAYQRCHQPEKYMVPLLKFFFRKGSRHMWGGHKRQTWKGMLWGNSWRHRHGKKLRCHWGTTALGRPTLE